MTRDRKGPHDYPRTARLNELVREIVADELERIDDDRLELVTVVAVEVEPDLRHATVFVSSPLEDETDDQLIDALGSLRRRLQAAIGRQARLKRVPELVFRPDEVGRSAARIEEILRRVRSDDPLDES